MSTRLILLNPGPKTAKITLNSGHLKERFNDGRFSDITVKAFERKWKLHKVTLSGSPYFFSLFTQGWRESADQAIQLQIPDETITSEALDVCFQALYTNEVELATTNVIAIQAAASFFQMDDLIQKCAVFMDKSMTKDTVVESYNASLVYGGEKTIKKSGLMILKTCITLVDQLSLIRPELMAEIMGCADTFCIQERSLYSTLTEWLYMKVTGSTFGNVEEDERTCIAFDYFRHLEGSTPFLSTENGRPYLKAFRQIRMIDLISPTNSAVQLRNDKIFPEDWIRTAVAENQERIKRGLMGVIPVSDLNERTFEKLCTREGFHVPSVRKGCKITSKILKCASMGIEIICENDGRNFALKIKRISSVLDAKPDEKREFLCRFNLVISTYKDEILVAPLLNVIKKISLNVDESFDYFNGYLAFMPVFDRFSYSVGVNYYLG